MKRASFTPLRTARPRTAQGGSLARAVFAPVLGTRPTLTPEQWRALRCLSIKDPWIRLVRLMLKPYELRKRPTRYRGPVVLCSSASPSRTLDARNARARHGTQGVWCPDEYGAALCIGNLVDCYPAEAKHERGACCPPVKGEFVWEFQNVWTLPRPLYIKGQLGLYAPPRELLPHLRRMLA